MSIISDNEIKETIDSSIEKCASLYGDFNSKEKYALHWMFLEGFEKGMKTSQEIYKK